MTSEKELFVTKQYVPTGQPIAQNDHTVVYQVKCLAEPGHPDGILKMYRKKNIKNLYDRLMQLDYSEWPHIYSVKYFDENTLVVEEFLKGHTLAELLEQNRTRNITFSEEEAHHIMEQICDALQRLMAIQPPIPHNNLKPSNIFITSTGAVKFLDFVPGYAKKKHPLRHILNILGSIFHEMLTGHKPSNGKSTYEGRYETVIRRCLEKSPEKSYSNVQELQEDIEYARTHEPETDSRRVKIPYPLTMPFQGFLLAFEWILISFFAAKDEMSTACLFVMIFLIHSILFAARRHTFLKKEGVYLPLTRRAYPILLLAAVLAALSWAVSFLIL